MRSDIIKVLNEYSSNLNKIIADSEIRLNWLKKSSSLKLHPLLDLIVDKIRNSNESLKGLKNDEIADLLFAKKINGIPVMDHMLNNSYGRPRDIINMLNIIKEEYPNATSFGADYFKDTRLEYSNRFIDELRNELATHYDSPVIEEAFSIVRFINKKTFWLNDVKVAIEDNQSRIHHFQSAEHYIDFAYEHGIVGNVWPNSVQGSNKKYCYSWRYREDGFEKPDYTKKFNVHLGLRKSLLG